MTPSVLAAIEGLKKAFPAARISVLSEDGQGGAFVAVEGVELGPTLLPEKTWLGAQLPSNLPYADVYPLFVGADVRKADGSALAGPFAPMVWQGRPAIQVSRRNNRVGAGHTAVSKFVKVIAFLKGSS
jgi:hypothetical protein